MKVKFLLGCLQSGPYRLSSGRSSVIILQHSLGFSPSFFLCILNTILTTSLFFNLNFNICFSIYLSISILNSKYEWTNDLRNSDASLQCIDKEGPLFCLSRHVLIRWRVTLESTICENVPRVVWSD